MPDAVTSNAASEPSPPPSPAALPPGRYGHRFIPGIYSGWMRVATFISDDEERKVKREQDKLNAALGLSLVFSLLLSHFVVDSARSLKNPSATSSRVNALWSASLVVNLAGASFGVLATLWPQSNPRDIGFYPRLYVRKRCSIAATRTLLQLLNPVRVLSYLLQVSLGLFSIGLYLYVTDANPDMSYWANAAVGGWLTIVSLTFVAPMLPQLASGFSLSQANCTTTRLFPSAANYPGNQQEMEEDADLELLSTLYIRYPEEPSLLSNIWDALRQYNARPEVLLRFVEKLFSKYPSHFVETAMVVKRSHTIAPRTLDLRFLPPDTYTLLLELVAELLAEEMHTQAGNNDTMRLNWVPCTEDMVYLILGRSSWSLPQYANATIGKFMTPQRADAFMTVVISSLHAGSSSEPMSADVASSIFIYALDRLGPAIDLLTSDVLSFNIGLLFVHCFCRHQAPTFHHGFQLASLILKHRADATADSLAALGDFLIDRLLKETHPEMFWHAWLVDMIHALMLICDALPKDASNARKNLDFKLAVFARTMLTQGKNVAIYSRYACGDNADELYTLPAAGFFADALLNAKQDERNVMIQNLGSVLHYQRAQPKEKADPWGLFVRLHPLKACSLLVQVVMQLKTRDLLPAPGSDGEIAFKALFNSACVAIAQWTPLLAVAEIPAVAPEEGAAPPPPPPATYPPAEIQRALQCLVGITLLDAADVSETATDEEFAAWARAFVPESSYIPDVLVQALSEAVPQPALVSFPRARRLAVVQQPPAAAPADEPAAPEPAPTPEPAPPTPDALADPAAHVDPAAPVNIAAPTDPAA